MGKGVFKYGGKSGILPKPRQIFKQPIEPVKVDPSIPQGFAPNIKHPKGSTREPIIPRPFTVDERIRRILPKQQIDIENKLKELDLKNNAQSTEKKYKILRSEMRKQFLIEALRKEEKSIAENKAKEQDRISKEATKARELEEMDLETQTTRLTLPTIENYLEGPIMRRRTSEEEKQMALKRKANRVSHELQVKETKAVDLLDLYYESEKFIIDENKLNDAIETAFEYSDYYNSVLNIVHRRLQDHTDYEERYINEVNDKFNYVLFGASDSNKPGTYEIEDSLSGGFNVLENQANSDIKDQTIEDKEKLLNSL